MTGYIAWKNNEQTIVPVSILAGEVGGDASSFTALTYGATTTWNTASAYFSKRTLALSGDTTLSLTNSVNGQRGLLVVTASTYGIISFPGYKANDLVTVLAPSEIRVYSYLYDGSNYYWQDSGVNSTGSTSSDIENTYTDHLLGTYEVGMGFTTSTNNGGTVSSLSGDPGNPGIYELSSQSTSNARASMRSNFVLWLYNTHIELEFIFRLRSLSGGTDQYNISAGFLNSDTNPSAGIYLYYDQNSTNIFYRVVGASTTSVNSGFTPAANTFYRAKIVVKKNSSVVFTIQGSNQQTITTNIPNSALAIVFTMNKTSGTNARQFDLDWYRFYHKLVA